MNTQKDTSPEKINKLYSDFLLYLDNTPGNMIPETLIQLETSIKLLVEDEVAYRLQRDEFERTIMQQVTGNKVNISDLLVQLGEKVQQILKKSPEEIDREMGIFVKELEGIILPPGEGNIREGSGKSEVREEKELTESRYGKILELLRENEIYADDIIVYKGQLRKSQMRQVSYRVIQIPRLSKTIFVCDEYGEASFVVNSLVYPEVFLEHTKSDIREKLSATRIIHSLAWETRMIEAIFGNSEERKVRSASEKNQTQKIDVQKMEEYREEILKQFPTPEDWMNLTQKQKTELKILGKGLKAISRFFGVIGNSIGYSEDMSLLGKKIYGEGNNFLDCEFWTEDDWKTEIQKQFPTPESWISLTRKQRYELKIYGKGLWAISTIFGVMGNPVGISQDMALLGKKIYGSQSIFEDFFVDNITKSWTEDDWKSEILKQFPTPECWINLTRKQKIELKINGKGLKFLSRLFGISGSPVSISQDMVLLGKAIYGDNLFFDDFLKEDMKDNWSAKDWKTELLGQFLTPEDWMNLTQEQKALKIRGKGLEAISTIFGISGNPVRYSRIMALFGQKIYGTSPVFDEYLKNKE